MSEFMAALGAGLGAGERLIVCGFPGDPSHAPPSAWRPRPWRPGLDVDLGPDFNGYVTVASFGKAQDGTWRRRRETFRAGLALMVDDVGTKVSVDAVRGLHPSARVLTSPGNEQWWYLLSEPERDAGRFDGVIRAFITGKLLGADPGMSGIARVGRIPGFLNGKAKYGGHFRTELLELNARRFTTEELLERFELKIHGRDVPRARLLPEEARERNRAFMAAYKWLAQHRMLKREEPDLSGWTEIRCPWMEGHTAQADTGAAISEPSEENGFYGGMRCHHGTCADRGWRELTDWINEQAVEELERAAQ